jgi:hypothetical protein
MSNTLSFYKVDIVVENRQRAKRKNGFYAFFVPQ